MYTWVLSIYVGLMPTWDLMSTWGLGILLRPDAYLGSDTHVEPGIHLQSELGLGYPPGA